MKKNVLLTVLMVFLMVMNGLLLYLVLRKSDRKPRPPKAFIAHELGFDERQMTKFMKFDEEHHQKMRAIDGQIRELKEILFSYLADEKAARNKIDSIGDRIGMLSKERELEVFGYFSSIEEICNESQKRRLKRIVTGALRPGPPGGRPPHDRPPPPR